MGRYQRKGSRLEYRFAITGLGGRLRRGVLTEQLVSLEPGRNTVRFESRGFGTRHAGGRVRLDLVSWPLPLEPTPATARRVHPNASVDQGVVSLLTVAMNDALVFDLTIPGADQVLADFLAERGLSSNLSDKGRYASALIGRLGGPQRLEALATEEALSILDPDAAVPKEARAALEGDAHREIWRKGAIARSPQGDDRWAIHRARHSHLVARRFGQVEQS